MWLLIERSKNKRNSIDIQYRNLICELSSAGKDKVESYAECWNHIYHNIISQPDFLQLAKELGFSNEHSSYSIFGNWMVAQGETIYKEYLESNKSCVLGYIQANKFSFDEENDIEFGGLFNEVFERNIDW